MKRKVFAFAATLFLIGVAVSVPGTLSLSEGNLFFRSSLAYSLDWRAEFDDVCSRSDDAMNLSTGEVKALIARCDALKPVIEQLDESTKKVYLKRLQMCRDLLIFLIESKEKK